MTDRTTPQRPRIAGIARNATARTSSTAIGAVLFWLTIMMFLGNLVASLHAAHPPLLSLPTHQTNRLEFDLDGDTLGLYILETSTDLNEWGPVATNESRSSRRRIGLPAPAQQGYVRAVSHPANRFRFALAAKDRIDLHGNELFVDNYDSTSFLFSTSGQYDPSKALDTAELATHNGIFDSFGDGGLTLLGTVTTGVPGSIQPGGNLVVGSKPWVDSGRTGIETGHFFNNLQLAFPEVEPPFCCGFAPAAGLVNGTAFDYVLGDGNYYLSSLVMSTRQSMAVVGQAALYVDGNVSITGAASIQILPGAQLEFYLGGSTAVISGAGVTNLAGPTGFSLFGTSSNLDLSLTVNGSLTACIYAPNADVIFQGPGVAESELFGSCSARRITLTRHLKVHYDEALRAKTPGSTP